MAETDPRGDAVIRRWERDKERAEERARHAEENFQQTISRFLSDPKKRRNVAVDLKEATKNPYNEKDFNSGFKGGGGEFGDPEIADWVRTHGNKYGNPVREEDWENE